MEKRFTIIIEKADGNFSAYSPEVPGCVATGATKEEAYQNMLDALKFHLEGLKLEKLPLDFTEVTVREAVL